MSGTEDDPDRPVGEGIDVRTWQEGGEYRRERVHHVDADVFADARERIDGDDGLEWGVGALVEHDGRVLLVREGSPTAADGQASGRWLLPGGEVETGESHAEALVRELREETGVRVQPDERLAVVRNVFRHDGERRDFRFAVHRATAETTDITDDPGLADEEIEAVRWVDDLPADTLDRDLLLELLGDGWS